MERCIPELFSIEIFQVPSPPAPPADTISGKQKFAAEKNTKHLLNSLENKLAKLLKLSMGVEVGRVGRALIV